MGFLLAGFGLLNLYLGIMIFKAVRVGTIQQWEQCGWGLCLGETKAFAARLQLVGLVLASGYAS